MIHLALDDNVSKLRELLAQYPEVDSPETFDKELEKIVKLYKEIRQEVKELGNDIEKWTEKCLEERQR